MQWKTECCKKGYCILVMYLLQHRVNRSTRCNIIILYSTLGFMYKHCTKIILYFDYKYYTWAKCIIIPSSNNMAFCFRKITSVVTLLQVFCWSSFLGQIVGRGDLILGAHQDRNHNVQSIRWLTSITTSLTPPTATTTFSATAAEDRCADRVHPEPTSVPRL